MITFYKKNFYFGGKLKLLFNKDPDNTDIVFNRRWLWGVFRMKVMLFGIYDNFIEFRLFGIKINKYGFFDYGHIRFKFLYDFKLSQKYTAKLLCLMLNKYIEYKTKSKDFTALLLHIATGEPFLYLSFFHEYIIKNNLKNVYLLGFRNSRILAHMLGYNFLKIHESFFNLKFTSFKDKNILDIDKIKYYEILENNIRKNKTIHFQKELIKLFCLVEKHIHYRKPIISRTAKISCYYKLKELNSHFIKWQNNNMIFQKPTVFIIPETISIKKLSEKMLERLVGELKIHGFEVIFNTIPQEFNQLKMWNKSVFLNYEEVLYLSDKVDYVISIRSGLLDIISSSLSKKFIIYYGMPQRGKYLKPLTGEEVKRAFTLKKLPFVNPNNVFEYNGEKLQENEITDDILNKIRFCNKK